MHGTGFIGAVRHLKKLSPRAVIAFFLTLVLCLLLVFAMVQNLLKAESLTMEQIVLE